MPRKVKAERHSARRQLVEIECPVGKQIAAEILGISVDTLDQWAAKYGIRHVKYDMEENKLKPKDLIEILDLSKGTISKILNYHKGLSKDTIRKLSHYFKVSQEAFNRPYKLVNEVNRHFRNASLMNTKKDLGNIVTV